MFWYLLSAQIHRSFLILEKHVKSHVFIMLVSHLFFLKYNNFNINIFRCEQLTGIFFTYVFYSFIVIYFTNHKIHLFKLYNSALAAVAQ